MDNKNNKKKKMGSKLRKWFKFRKQTRKDPDRLNELSDGGEDESDDYVDDIYVPSLQMDPCTSTKELRIFVGTWNVAGRSPVGSPAVDLDKWLNLKEAADIYVLGFQEIVPLKTRTVIGPEDPTEATNWNLLLGKTLNNRFRCPWLTPMLNPISSDNYNSVSTSDPERRTSFRGSFWTPMRERSRKQLRLPQFTGSKYKLMASKKMVGVFISVWMKTELLRKYHVSNVKVCSVACGIMGYLGNKGSVSVSMIIEGTSFCFIAAHLASGEKKGDEGRRNHQVTEIFRRTLFPRSSKDNDNSRPLTILGHDKIFWFGDLNYRLYLEDALARHLINQQDWKALQQFDQLRREQEDGGVFEGWKEGNIEFAPTYKYSSSNCNRYSGGLPSRSGEKQRTPAWCDRILWYGKGVKQLSYLRSEIKFSDHRPVSASFSTQVEVIKSTNPRFVKMDTFGPNMTRVGTSKNDKEAKSTLQSLMGDFGRSWARNITKPNVFCTWIPDFWYGGRLIYHHYVNPKQLFQTFMILVSTGRVIAETGSMTTDLSKGSNGIGSVFAVLDRYTVIVPDEPEGYEPKKITGHVELLDVDFAYPSRLNTVILQGFSLKIEAGKSMAFGRSTIMGLN